MDANNQSTEAAVVTPAAQTTPATISALIAAYAVYVITGLLVWVKPELSKDGFKTIAILRDGETATDDQDRLLLTGITLTKPLSERFDAALGDAIIKGETRLSVTIRTKDFEADLAAGKGRNRTGLPYFVGQAIELTDLECQ